MTKENGMAIVENEMAFEEDGIVDNNNDNNNDGNSNIDNSSSDSGDYSNPGNRDTLMAMESLQW